MDKAPGADAADAPQQRVNVRSAVRLFHGHSLMLSSALVLTLIGAVVTLTQPWLTKVLIDAVGDGEAIRTVSITLASLFLLGAVTDALSQFLLERVGEEVARDLRRTVGSRLLFAPLTTMSRFRTGDLIARTTSDVTVVREMLARSLVQLFSVAVYGVGTIVMMLNLDSALLAVMAVTVVVATALVASVLAGIRAATERAQGAVGTFAADLERILGSVRTVKAFSAEDDERSRLNTSADAAYRGGIDAARLSALVSPAIELAVNGALLVVLLLGGVRVATGEMPVGDLVAFLLYATYLVLPLAGLFSALATLQQGLAALQRINETERLGSEDRARSPAPVLSAGTGASIVFESVSARYGSDRNALTDATFALTGPGLVALTGMSGAGKTTIINILERFVDPAAGRVVVNGVDIIELDPLSHRRSLTLVDQDAPLLEGTIRENLLYGRIAVDSRVDDRRLTEVIDAAGLTQCVALLPQGVDSQVGERGRAVSGGERQRLALARALLAPSPIYLFDEPSSSLDPENERLVAETIRQLSEEHLVLVVTHQAKIVGLADTVLIVADGRVTSLGPPR